MGNNSRMTMTMNNKCNCDYCCCLNTSTTTNTINVTNGTITMKLNGCKNQSINNINGTTATTTTQTNSNLPHIIIPHYYKSYYTYLKLKKKSKTIIEQQNNYLTNNNVSNVNGTNEIDHYIDKEFPPINTSLYRKEGKSSIRNKLIPSIHSLGFKQVKIWLRPNEIFVQPHEKNLPICLFMSNTNSKDVIQGELGTCWFLSALALIAENNLLLFNSLLTKEYNSNGLHKIRLCKRGEWKIIDIDDYLPCDRFCKLVFSRAKRRQLWVPFMEKALAKMYGSYENIAKGACAEGLQTLTGEPCQVLYLRINTNNNSNKNNNLNKQQLELQHNEQVWLKLIESKQNGYLMTTLCYNEQLSELTFLRNGLLNRHIYSILDVKELVDTESYNNKKSKHQQQKQVEVHRLLKLRNPWGHKEWKGDWSKNSSLWTKNLKQQINQNELISSSSSSSSPSDGCFWISYNDILKYFYDITICKVRANWNESRQSSCFYDYSNGNEGYLIKLNDTNSSIEEYEFEIELFSTGYLTKEFDRNKDPTCDLCLIICKLNKDKLNIVEECIAFEHSVEYYITLSIKLKTNSTYLIFATSIKAISPIITSSSTTTSPSSSSTFSFSASHNNNNNNNNATNHLDYSTYNIAIHGSTQFTIERIRFTNELISDIYYSLAKMQNIYKQELNGQVKSYIIQGTCTHGILIENLSYNLWIKVILDIKTSTNLESTRLTQETIDLLRPRSRQLLSFLTPINYRNGYIIGYKLDIKLLDTNSQQQDKLNNSLIKHIPAIVPNYRALHLQRDII